MDPSSRFVLASHSARSTHPAACRDDVTAIRLIQEEVAAGYTLMHPLRDMLVSNYARMAIYH